MDRTEVLARARAAGVSALIITSSNLDDSEAAIAVAQTHEGYAAAAGTHPARRLAYRHARRHNRRMRS